MTEDSVTARNEAISPRNRRLLRQRTPRNDNVTEDSMSDRQYCVYIMTNTHNTVLYTGVTNNLQRRVLEHKSGTGSKFTSKYNVDKLVYFECGDDVNAAIAREKQIKAGSRKKKIDLVNSMNSEWKDLFDEFFK
jgi:putative endonuclease